MGIAARKAALIPVIHTLNLMIGALQAINQRLKMATATEWKAMRGPDRANGIGRFGIEVEPITDAGDICAIHV